MPSHEEYLQAIAKVEALHSTPEVLAKVASKVRDPNSDIEDIVEILRTDAALTADIVRLSNSAYYGTTTPIRNVAQAMARIGFNEVLRLVNLCIAKSVFNKDLDCYGIRARDYWATGVSCGLLMEELAHLHGENPSDAYTLGVMHATGRVVINQILQDFGMGLFWDTRIPLEEWERREVGYDYAFAGAELLRRWKFPEDFCQTIQDHLDGAQKPEASTALQSLHYCASFVRTATPNLDQTPPPETDFTRQKQLATEDLEEIVARVRQRLQTTEKTLGIAS